MKFAKDLLFDRLPLAIKKRLINALLRSATSRASIDEIASLEDLNAAQEWNQLLLEDKIRQLRFSNKKTPVASTGRSPLQTWIMDENSPWKKQGVRQIEMPGMISDEEIQYYSYIGSIYEGRGEVVELGPWLGKSTRHIIRSLLDNAKFAGKKLHVFDDFVWRTRWMNQYVPEADRLPNHADFRFMFDTYVENVSSHLHVTQGKIVDHDGNEGLPPINWERNRPIEMMYIDCGRTIEVNEGWFEIFSASFIPNVTLLIMQDWRLHRERPRQHYNQTNWFTAAHPELELVHEVRIGGLATFLFRGNS